MKRVLITRPEPGAATTARQLRALGYEAVVLPLTETRAMDVSEPPPASELDAVVATSGAALRHARPDMLRDLTQLPLFAVGDRTADTARAAGFQRVQSANGDSPALATHIARSLPAGSRLAYLCGRVRTGALAERLRKTGFGVAILETYDTLPIGRTDEEVAAALDGKPVDVALLYSANAAVLFARLAAGRAGFLLRQARMLCISPRTAQALSPAAQDRAEVAATPDEAALLALLGGAT